ncbi:MAG TPA: STAS domain-containing protein [Pyrinomonadaceae bacterium]|nr:STAS domain-containing protein [Pyrinomonadaceae bacterium]
MLKVNVKSLGNIAVLSVQGQIVHGETAVLRDTIQSLSGISAIKLDLARVAMIDAGGLGALLELREAATSKAIRFELMNVSRQIARVFQICRLDTVFDITPNAKLFAVAPQNHRFPARALACA